MYSECALHLGVQIRSIGEHLRALELAREQQNAELAACLKRSLVPLDCLMRRLEGLRTHMVALLLRVDEREPLRPTNRSFEELVRLYEVSCRFLTEAIAPFEKLRVSDDLSECASTLLQLKTLHKQLQASSHGLYSVNGAHSSTPNPSASGLEQQMSDLSRLQLSIEAVDAFVDTTNGALPNSVLSSIDFHSDSSDSCDSRYGSDKPVLFAPSGEPMTPPPLQMLPRKLTSGRQQHEQSSSRVSQDTTAASNAVEVLQLQRSVGQLWQRFESVLARERTNSGSNAASDSSASEPTSTSSQATLLENVLRSNTIASPLLYTQQNPPSTVLQVPALPPFPYAVDQSDYLRLFEGYSSSLLPDASIASMTAFNPQSVSPNTLMSELAAAQQGVGIAPRSNSISSLERRPHGGSLNETAHGPNEELLAGIGLVPPDQQPAAHLSLRYRSATDRSEVAASEECNSVADRASARPSMFLLHPSLDNNQVLRKTTQLCVNAHTKSNVADMKNYLSVQTSLFCPSRVAINRGANEVAVLEPKPSSQVGIFSADGSCVRKIGQQMLVNSEAVCVDLTELDEDGKLVRAYETDQVPRSLVGMWDMDTFRELSPDACEDAAAAASDLPGSSVV